MNIFIAGLTYQITEHDLRELFEDYGTVSSAKIITDNLQAVLEDSGLLKWTMPKRVNVLLSN